LLPGIAVDFLQYCDKANGYSEFPGKLFCCIFGLLKFKAFILLVAVLAYVGEWLAMPASMDMSGGASSASPKMCCEKEGDHRRRCLEDCPKPEKQDKGAADCCLSCPMCYTMILPSAQEHTQFFVTVKKLYPSFQSNYVYGYPTDAWKPPNRA
jgi:hypothetical protein